MPAKQEAPGACVFAGKCYLSTLLTKRRGCLLHAPRRNVSVWQTALPLLPSVSQEEITSSIKFCREVRHRLSRARAVIWHIVTAHSQMRNCCFGVHFLLPWTMTVLWCDGKGAVSRKSTQCFEKKQAVKSGLPLAPRGEGPYNQLQVPVPVLYSSLLFWLYVVG